MRKTWALALMLLALIGPAAAETVTITTTLGERGFSNGLLLSGRQTGSIYLPLPAKTDIANLRVVVRARSVAPNLQRGSLVVIVNGQPVDALRLDESPRAQTIGLDTAIEAGTVVKGQAMDLRFRADLIARADRCTDQFDPANTLQILPETTIAYEVDLEEIDAIGDVLALLPRQADVELTLPLTPAASQAALRLSTMLTNEGYHARFRERGHANGPVSIRLVQPSADASIRLEHDAGDLRLLVPENADLSAFARLWEAVPWALDGEAIAVEGANATGGAGAAPAVSLTLPGPLRVAQTGEIGLDFPLLDNNGRRAHHARLNLMVAPDWSNATPAVTIQLNGQLISASRAEIGENILTASFPPDLLAMSNRLAVTVERAQAPGYCPGADPGQNVQLLPGTEIIYEDGSSEGFAGFADALRGGGTLLLPKTATGADGLAYLTLASRILDGLGLHAVPLDVMFGEATDVAVPVLAMSPVGREGLILPIGQPEMTLSTPRPLASVTVDASRQRLDVRVLEGEGPPDPVGVYLGSGTAALIGSEGVIWQDAPASRKPSLVQQAREVSQGFVRVLRGEAVFWGLIGLAAIIMVVLARALLKGFFRRQASR